MPLGRPSSYTPEKAAIICQRISDGGNIRAICQDPDLPSIPTLFKWLNDVPEFLEQYTRAREVQADVYAAEIVELSDKCRVGEKIEKTQNGRICSECERDVRWIEGRWAHGSDKTPLCDGAEARPSYDLKITEGDMIERSRLQIDARKWAASKLAPKKYGERLQTALTDAEGNATGFAFGIIASPAPKQIEDK